MELILYAAILSVFFYRSKNKLLLASYFVVLLLYAGYRDIFVGTDTLNYLHHFDLVSSGGKLHHELLWYVLNKLVFISGGSFQTVLIVSSVLTLLPVFYVSYKKSPYPLLSIFFFVTLYYYFYSFNIMRQSIAISWGLLSFYFMDRDKSIKSYLTFVFSILFHFSSIVILPALLLLHSKFNIKKKTSYILLFASFVLGLFFWREMTDLMLRYLYSSYQIEAGLNLLGPALMLVFINGLYILFSFISKGNNNWLNLYFFFLLFSNLTVRIPMANRFTFFFGITLIIYYPLALNKNKLEAKYELMVLALLITYSLLNFYTLWGKGGILPYENVLF